MDLSKAGQWNRRFLGLAGIFAGWSVDPSTRVGCVIVGPDNEIRSYGYNGLPRNVEDSGGRLERPGKYFWVEHAERNALYSAARNGVSTKGCRIYLTWFPCVDCARGIIQSGISEVIAVEPDWDSDRWGGQFRQSRQLLMEAGVELTLVDRATEDHNAAETAEPIEALG